MVSSRGPFEPKFSELPGTVPIFPLSGAVLLPGGRLPLNIFEPRYLSMVRDAIASPHRLIGMIQSYDDADEQGRAGALYDIAENVCLKVPLTPDGLRACKHFSDQGKMVNVTLCFSASQALLAAKAGASFISPFVGRLDDIAIDGMGLIQEIRTIYDNYDFNTQILVASTRHNLHILDSALIGADVATIPPKVVHQLFKHPLTDSGLAGFLKDWEKTGQSIAD